MSQHAKLLPAEVLTHPAIAALVERGTPTGTITPEQVRRASDDAGVEPKHLKALHAAGLVSIRVDGPRRLYSLDPAPLAELDAWLAPYRDFWTGKLDALGDHLMRTD